MKIKLGLVAAIAVSAGLLSTAGFAGCSAANGWSSYFHSSLLQTLCQGACTGNLLRCTDPNATFVCGIKSSNHSGYMNVKAYTAQLADNGTAIRATMRVPNNSVRVNYNAAGQYTSAFGAACATTYNAYKAHGGN